MRITNKRGFELAISTMVVLVLALLILIALTLILTGTFEKFWKAVQGYSDADVAAVSLICESECKIGRAYDFCCVKKDLGNTKITCLNERMNLTCAISNCEQICGGEEES